MQYEQLEREHETERGIRNLRLKSPAHLFMEIGAGDFYRQFIGETLLSSFPGLTMPSMVDWGQTRQMIGAYMAYYHLINKTETIYAIVKDPRGLLRRTRSITPILAFDSKGIAVMEGSDDHFNSLIVNIPEYGISPGPNNPLCSKELDINALERELGDVIAAG